MVWSFLSAIALVFNELMPANVGVEMSPAINFDSWVELYNPSNESVNLSGMYLSNDAENLKLWRMPSDVGTVPAKGFKVLWLGSNDIKSNQAPFKLDCSGGSIYLSDKNGQLVTSLEYPKAMSRVSYACKTDGSDEWGWTADVTPGSTNTTSAFATERLDAPVVNLGSQLFTGTLNVKVDIPEGTTLMYTTDGSLPAAPKGDEGAEASPWHEWIKNGDCEGDDETCLIGKDGDGNGKYTTTFVEGAGYNNSRCIKVHSVSNATEAWTTQFFVYTPDHIWNVGDKYRFRMKIRADYAAKITVQSHKAPGSYIYWSMLDGSYDVTTQWKEIVYTGTITSEQAGSSGGGWWGNPTPSELQTIAFNLNEKLNQENNYYIDDVSWESATDEVVEPTQQSKDGKFTLTNTTNLTFRLFRKGFLPSIPVVRSYIKTNQKYTIPVVSIVGDTRYFTDSKIGIDCDGDGTNGKIGNGQDVPRNYNQDWERPVNFSYLSPEGKMLFNQDVNISVSGGWTRSQPIRSFKLKSNKVFDGQNHLDYSFFSQKPYIRNKGLLLRNGGNDYWTHGTRFMDPALETVIQRSGIDIDVQSYQPIIEYVNGEFRGVLNLRELNNDKFAYANFGYADDELDAFENLTMKNGTDEVINRIFELGRHINEDGAYDELKKLLDIDEFTNYMAVTMFLDNDDWPNNNIKAYRSQHDGRYRFISFDLDYAFGLRGVNSSDNPFTHFVKYKDDKTVPNNEGNPNREIVNLLINLWGHDEFRRKFIDTFCIIAGSVFEEKRAISIVEELAERVRPMTELDGRQPDRCVSTIKSKLKGRANKMTNFMQQFNQLNLASAQKQAVVLNSNHEGGRIFINDIEVPYSDFNGYLFAPVKLKAQAPGGYRFSGWKNGNTVVSNEETIDLPSDNSVSLTASFTPLTQDERTEQRVALVRINEVSAANEIYVNEFWKRNDWVELYNTTSKPVDVEGMYLSDNPDKPKKYIISKGETSTSTIIPANGYLIIWCDKLEAQSQLHATFKLAAEGGSVLLTAADESWTDRLDYSEHKGDETIARYPDGSNDVYLMTLPTIAKSNIANSYRVLMSPSQTGIDFAEVNNTNDYSVQYVVNSLVIRGGEDEQMTVNVYNMSGQLMESLTAKLNGGYAELSMLELPKGCYVAKIIAPRGNNISCKFIKN